jgi:hypothetical protein
MTAHGASRKGIAAALFLALVALGTVPALALPECSNSRQISKWEAYGNDFGWTVYQKLDAQYGLNAGDDGMLTFGDTVWVVKDKAASKVAAITRLAVDGVMIAATKPSKSYRFALVGSASDTALAAFRKGRSGAISLALGNGSKRDLAIDLAGFGRAMDTAKRFFAKAKRGAKARTCKSVF